MLLPLSEVIGLPLVSQLFDLFLLELLLLRLQVVILPACKVIVVILLIVLIQVVRLARALVEPRAPLLRLSETFVLILENAFGLLLLLGAECVPVGALPDASRSSLSLVLLGRSLADDFCQVAQFLGLLLVFLGEVLHLLLESLNGRLLLGFLGLRLLRHALQFLPQTLDFFALFFVGVAH